MATYMIEAALYNGEHFQSDDFVMDGFRESWRAITDEPIRDFRRRTMVESVAVIHLETGEVVWDVPGFTVLARRRRRGDYVQPV